MTTVDLTTTIRTVELLTRLAALRADGGSVRQLQSRLRRLLDAPSPPSTARGKAQAIIDFEHAVWSEVISDLLLPEVRDAVITALSVRTSGDRSRPPSANVWSALDPDVRALSDRCRAVDVLVAQHQAIAACRRYVRTRHVRYLFDAVRALESAVRCEQYSGASGLTPGSCAVEAERLGQALSDALPPFAFSFLADRIRDLIRTQVAEQHGNRHGRAGRMDEEQEQWLSREAWTDVSHEEPSAEGPWFVDFLQDQYQEQLELARRTEEEAGRQEPRASIWAVGAPLSSRVGTEPDREDERTPVPTPGDPRLDDGPGVEPDDRAELPADFEAASADRRSITEQEPSGCVNLAMEEAVKEELDRRARLDAEMAQREADRAEYRYQLSSRR